MKKSILGLIVAIIIVGGAFAAYTMLYKDSKGTVKPGSSSPQPSTGISEQVSLDDLFTRNVSLECTFEVNEDNSINTGVAYFSESKEMYGEFTSKTKDNSTTANVLRKNNEQYVWQKGSKEGYKADVSKFDEEKQNKMSQQIDPNKKYQFNCKNWAKDKSKFIVPSDVQFKDISVMLNQAESLPTVDRQQACEAITDTATKEACKKAL